jgi:hypothetical protein
MLPTGPHASGLSRIERRQTFGRRSAVQFLIAAHEGQFVLWRLITSDERTCELNGVCRAQRMSSGQRGSPHHDGSAQFDYLEPASDLTIELAENVVQFRADMPEARPRCTIAEDTSTCASREIISGSEPSNSSRTRSVPCSRRYRFTSDEESRKYLGIRLTFGRESVHQRESRRASRSVETDAPASAVAIEDFPDRSQQSQHSPRHPQGAGPICPAGFGRSSRVLDRSFQSP